MDRVYEMQMCGLSLLKSIANSVRTFNLGRYQKIKRKEKKRKEERKAKREEVVDWQMRFICCIRTKYYIKYS